MKQLKFITITVGMLLLIACVLYITKREVPVLLYHHLLEDAENISYRNSSVITPERFEEQIKWLRDNGYETLTLDELYDFIVNKSKLPDNRVLITFDDGYLSVCKYAYPILKKYGYTAAIFMVTSEINETPQPFDPGALVFMSLSEMEQSLDVFEFGSHTHDMHSQTEDNTPFIIYHTDDKVKADFEESFSFPYIKKYLAYPFGYFKKSNHKTLEELDTNLAFTIGRGNASQLSNRYKVPRRIIRGDTTLEEFIRIVR